MSGPSSEYYNQKSRDMSQMGGLSGGAQPPTTSTTPPIQGAILQQRDTIRGLHQTINELEGRLRPVLADGPPPEVKNEKEARETPQLLDHIHMHNQMLSYALARLADITSRLHV